MSGLPRWLEIVLVAAGLLIAICVPDRARPGDRPAPSVQGRGRPADDTRIVLADYERLVVTHSRDDGTVYVLRPPGADPHAILLAARLVLAQDGSRGSPATSESPPTDPENEGCNGSILQTAALGPCWPLLEL